MGIFIMSVGCLNPPILWAQTNNLLYVTIDLPDIKDKVLECKDHGFHFQGKSGANTYKTDLKFFDAIDSENIQTSAGQRQLTMTIKKKEPTSWPQLLADIKKAPWLRFDFNRFVDDDASEPEFEGGNDFSGLLNQMNTLGGGYDQDGDIDSDDEDLPDLEPPTATANGEEEESKKETEEETPKVEQPVE